MAFLDALIYGVRDIYAAGVGVTRRSQINFVSGVTVVDNVATGRTDITLTAGAPSGAAGGALGGTYPNPTIAATQIGEYRTARVVSVVNLTLSGAQTIDGIACIAGDRVFAAGQTAGQNNGIYVVAAGAWAYATDWAQNLILPAVRIGISEGTTYAGSLWRCTTPGPYTIGTTVLSFDDNVNLAAVGFGAAGPTITSGTGIPATTPANGSLFMRTDGGAASGLYLREAAAWTALAAGAAVGGADTQVLFNDAASENGVAGFTFVKATNDLKVTGSGAFGGATVASAGAVRLPTTAYIKQRNAGNTADYILAGADNSDNCTLGGFWDGTLNATQTFVNASSFIYARIAGNTILQCSATYANFTVPIFGSATPNSAVDGRGAQVITDGANTTVAVTVYSRKIQQLTGAITANRTAVWPLPGAEDGSYEKVIQNQCTGAFSVVISMSSGVTATIANGKTATCIFTPSGVYRTGPDT